MGIYRLNAGRHRRFENGQLTQYTAGDMLELSDEEVRRLSHRITPVDQRAKSLSAPVTSGDPDPTQAPTQKDKDSEDPDSAPGGTPVFTAADTPSRTFTELRHVIANVGDPVVVDDMIEAESAVKKRTTVLRMLETRKRMLQDEARDQEEPS